MVDFSFSDAYSKFVQSRTKPGYDIGKHLASNPDLAHLLHMAVGVAGEAGELLDAVKKAAVYNKPLDITNVIEELGDLEFYMQGIRTTLRVTRLNVLQQNVAKLEKRYKQAYSDYEAQTRADKESSS